MIEKIIEARNVGQFAHLKPFGDAQFKKVTLVFGRNGTGKSTIASILRAAGERSGLDSRQRLAAPNSVTVTILTAQGQLKKAKGIWTGPTVKVSVFDRQFIDSNVHLGGEVQPETRQNLLQLALGDAEVAAAKAVDQLTKDIESLTKERAALVKQIVPVAADYRLSAEPFLKLGRSTNSTARLTQLETLIANAKNAEPIRLRNALTPVLVPSSPDWSRLERAMGRTVAAISDQARVAVEDHIAHRLGGPQARNWVEQGLRYAADDENCPFCGQERSGSFLISAYSEFFSKLYDDFLIELRGLVKAVAQRKQSWTDVGATIQGNEASRDFWEAVLKRPAPIVAADAASNWESAFQISGPIVDRKLSDPLLVPDELGSTIATVEALTAAAIASLVEYNRQVAEYNELIQLAKVKTQTTSLQILETEKTEIHAAERRHRSDVCAIATSIQHVEQSKKMKESEKERARTLLSQARSKRLGGFEAAVNAVLKDLGAKFAIETLAPDDRGGRPAVKYALLVNGKSVPATSKGDTAPTFRTLLSDGDKSCLALAVFVASIKLSSDAGNQILVFDDPMTSLDEDRTYQTVELIESMNKLTKQVIVLSHIPQFLRAIGHRISSSNLKVLEIDADSEVYRQCDLDLACQDEFVRAMTSLRDCALGSAPGTEDVRRCIRVVLEGYLRVRFPDMWGPLDWLGDFSRKAGSDAVVAGLVDLTELEQIKNFSSPSHHAPGSPHYLPVTPSAIRQYAERTYVFVAGRLV